MPMHKFIFHPDLEYYVQFWFPGVDMGQSQRGAAKMTVVKERLPC